MILSENGRYFELVILGYEFPDSIDQDDASWLEVQIEVKDGESISWKAKDSCLRTFELEKLRDWFQSINLDSNEGKRIYFTENELSFVYEPPRLLKVVLDYNLHPKGDKYDYDLDNEYILNFKLSQKILHELISELRGQVLRYPA